MEKLKLERDEKALIAYLLNEHLVDIEKEIKSIKGDTICCYGQLYSCFANRNRIKKIMDKLEKSL